MMPDWEALYQANDMGWDRGESSPALAIWQEKGMFEAGKRVLIPGCGQGYEVVALVEKGCEVTGIDIAPTAVKRLQQRLKETEVLGQTQVQAQSQVICADLFTYQSEQTFDVVYEQTCLCAISLEQREAYEQCLWHWLKPDGKLLWSMMQTGEKGGPPFHCDWSDMRLLFPESRWAWQEEVPFVVPRWKASPRFELGFVLTRL